LKFSEVHSKFWGQEVVFLVLIIESVSRRDRPWSTIEIFWGATKILRTGGSLLRTYNRVCFTTRPSLERDLFSLRFDFLSSSTPLSFRLIQSSETKQIFQISS
jgi:hypothetical protein